MGKYINQQDAYSCGPIAVYNAFKWAGLEGTYDDWKYILKFVCCCIPPNGTRYGGIKRALKHESGGMVTFIQDTNPRYSLASDCITNGGAVILNYRTSTPGKRHYAFFDRIDDYHVQGVNVYSSVVQSIMTLDQFNTLFELGSPIAWYLEKT